MINKNSHTVRAVQSVILLALFLNMGCAATTRVVLLPDLDGKVGAIDISSAGGVQTLDKPWQATEVSRPAKAPSEPWLMDEWDVGKMFKSALAAKPVPPVPQAPPVKAIAAPQVLEEPKTPKPEVPPAALAPQPVPPKSFIIYFRTAAFDLSTESLKALSEILEEIKTRKSINISVSGHTDTFGPAKKNQALSQKRAKAVADFFIGKDVNPENIHVTYHGEKRLLIPTPDSVNEPRNRRVEIIVQ